MSNTIRIVDAHNRPGKRLKSIRDMQPRDAIIEIWKDPKNIKVLIPESKIAGYNIETLIEKMVKPEQIEKY